MQVHAFRSFFFPIAVGADDVVEFNRSAHRVVAALELSELLLGQACRRKGWLAWQGRSYQFSLVLRFIARHPHWREQGISVGLIPITDMRLLGNGRTDLDYSAHAGRRASGLPLL